VGNKSDARMAMMAMTTSNSINVNARRAGKHFGGVISPLDFSPLTFGIIIFCSSHRARQARVAFIPKRKRIHAGFVKASCQAVKSPSNL
jgi:hypothetical protein